MPSTYAWSLKQDIGELNAFIRASFGLPLIVVGSGGAYTAATYAAHLHERLTGQLSVAVTPLEFASRRRLGTSVLFLSAGGTNPDINGAFHAAVAQDSKTMGLVCFRRESKLSSLAQSVSTYTFVEDLPTGSDGFLATNSLIAFFTLLSRSYASVFSLPDLQKDFEECSSSIRLDEGTIVSAVERRHLIALFGPQTRALATDLESKFSEAGLSSVQLADFRNFAHGRHHWIAKRANETAIVAFVSPEVESIAGSTLRLIEGRVPLVTVRCSGSAESMIAGLSAVFRITAFAGASRGVDPGRPGVPEFGRKIYHLRTNQKAVKPGAAPSLSTLARRKFPDIWERVSDKERSDWMVAATAFSKRLDDARFGSVVFDFDGTICSRRERFTKLRSDVTTMLESLLRHGITVGIATGRGKSVGKQMRDSLARKLWDKVWIAYYNGGDVGLLSDEHKPNVAHEIHPAIEHARQALCAEPSFSSLVSTTVRPTQISVDPKVLMTSECLWKYTAGIIERNHVEVRVIFSTHSVDIVPRHITKSTLTHKLQERLPGALTVLCIGDLGHYPGNDFDLLTGPASLSSDQVSTDTKSCWNMAPLATSGIDATLYYLRHARIEKGFFRLRVPLVDAE